MIRINSKGRVLMDTIYVTGHRIPDTDSIVSAMAYAGLQRAMGSSGYVAARLGPVSDETKSILDHFGYEPPVLINNVRTQVSDLDFDTPPIMHSGVTMKAAWEKLQNDPNVRGIPVINTDGTLYGMLSPGDVASYDMRSVDDPSLDEIPLFNMVGALEGKIMNEGGEYVTSVSGEVVVALPQSIPTLQFDNPDSIVICGDQPDVVRRALDLKVRCVIVCQAEIPMDLRDAESSTPVISTPLSCYQAVRRIFQAVPISRLCRHEDIISVHLTDYIDDIRDVIASSHVRSFPILDENEKVVGTLSRYHLLRPKKKKVVLVDHNEMAQTVPGLSQADLMGIIDHHRLADIQTTNPVMVRNEPVGSTATIVAGMYQDYGLMPSPRMAGLLACAVISDTVMFKSPTATPRDRQIAERMARIANESLEDLGNVVFDSGTNSTRSVSDILFTDFKEFHIAGHDLGVGQLTCLDADEILKRKDEFLAEMARAKEEKHYDFILLMLTDVLKEGTDLIFLGDEDVINQAFSCQAKDNTVFLPKVMSRKKQIIPMLSTMWG